MHAAPILLHIPDGFLSSAVALSCWLLTVVVVAVTISRTNKTLGDRQVPLMGVMAAFIFAAQMLNFPVAGGTSGHLLGAALAAILLGPWPAIIIMTAVIAVQGLLFQDGGLLAMGANILNMGILAPAAGYGLYRLARNRSRRTRLLAAGLAAWLAIFTSAVATSIELWLSGTVRLDIVIRAMAGLHALIGIGEALITVGALAFVLTTRPDLLEKGEASAKGGHGWVLAGGLISLAAIAFAPLASADPDGLTRVAMNLGFLDVAGTADGPFAGYRLSFLSWGAAGRIAAGLLGALLVTVLILLSGRALREKPTAGKGDGRD